MLWFIDSFIVYKSGLDFSVKELAKFSVNPGKLHFKGLVHLLRYIRYNKTLVLKYYVDMNDVPVSDLLRQASIKTDNHLIDFLILVDKVVQTLEEVQKQSLSFIKVGQLTMAHMFQDQLLNQVQKVKFTAGMALAHFRMLIHEMLNKDPYIVP